MNKVRYTQTYLCLCVLFAIITLVYGNVAQTTLMVGLAISVALLGLPHGALDFSIARALKLANSLSAASIFIFVYLLIAGVSIAFWVMFPALALSLFLLISVYHFASDWRTEMPSFSALSLASIVLSGPAIFHAPAVLQLFQNLFVSEQNAITIVLAMRTVFVCSSLIFIVFLSKVSYVRHQKWSWSLSEYLTLIMSALLLPPLLHFGLYFCVLHSPKHLIDVGDNLGFTFKQTIIASLPFVVLTVLIALLLYFQFSSININIDLLRWIFIGLFGLTMSHMFLVNIWHRSTQTTRL